mmetsp:Transcript_24203/g.43344  ORF Transcript_24203/g.43344 Transcript_24203/m.43344 type:complete len:215 (-) Transcript_24203:334-978(-)
MAQADEERGAEGSALGSVAAAAATKTDAAATVVVGVVVVVGVGVVVVGVGMVVVVVGVMVVGVVVMVAAVEAIIAVAVIAAFALALLLLIEIWTELASEVTLLLLVLPPLVPNAALITPFRGFWSPSFPPPCVDTPLKGPCGCWCCICICVTYLVEVECAVEPAVKGWEVAPETEAVEGATSPPRMLIILPDSPWTEEEEEAAEGEGPTAEGGA